MVGPFQAGHKLSVGEMNEIARAVAKIMRLSGDKFIQVTHTADGTTLRLATEDLGAYLPKTRRGRWARLTAWNESDNTYSWIRLQDDGATEYVPAETGALNAKEVNGVEGIPVGAAGIGKVVWLERARPADPADPDEWRFVYERGVFWGEIVTDATGGAYTFKEKVLTDGTTWTDKTGGRTGTVNEANDVAGIAVGTIIKIRVEHDTGGTLRYVFDTGGALPLADARYNALVANDVDLIFKPGWVRAH